MESSAIFRANCNQVSDICSNALDGTSSTLFLMMINYLYSRKCTFLHKNDFPKNLNANRFANNNFDFVIVGAGSAGAIVANRLSENPNWTVLLIEAGGYPTSDNQIPNLFVNVLGNPTWDWDYKTERSNSSCLGMVDGQCIWNRGKILGGSSSLNAMMYVRANPIDYNNWAKINDDPLWAWDNVIEYFKMHENVQDPYLRHLDTYGTNGSLHLTKYKADSPLRQVIIDGYKELGYSLQKEEVPIGCCEVPVTIDEWGRRESTAKAFLTNGQHKNLQEDENQNAPPKRKNLFIITQTHVMKVLIRDGKAIGVKAKVNNSGIVDIFAKKEVIVSAGSINSPQILQLSGIGPKEDLSKHGIKLVKDLPVGKNLQDHLVSWGVILRVDPDVAPAWTKAQEVNNIINYFNNGSGYYSTVGTFNLQLFIDPYEQNQEAASIQFQMNINPVRSSSLREVLINLGFSAESINDLERLNREQPIITYLPCLLTPESRGYLELNSSDPFDKIKIHTEYLTSGNDLDKVLAAIDFIRKVINTKAFQKVNAAFLQYKLHGCDRFTFDTSDYWECLFRHMGSTMYHPVGTCKMAKESDEGVVDSRLKVHGVESLRVIDASIMPVITRGNTNAPTMMIAEMGADFIKKQWKFRT